METSNFAKTDFDASDCGCVRFDSIRKKRYTGSTLLTYLLVMPRRKRKRFRKAPRFMLKKPWFSLRNIVIIVIVALLVLGMIIRGAVSLFQ